MEKSDQLLTRYLLPEEYGLWDQLADHSPDGSVFHTSKWLTTFAGWQHLEFRIAGCFKGDELVGGMAFTSRRKYGLRVVQIPVKTPFFGPVVAPTETRYPSKTESRRHAVLGELARFMMSETSLFSAILPPLFIDVRPFIWMEFETGLHYTFLVNMDRDADLLSMYDPSVRRQISKGEKTGHSLVTENSREYILLAREMEQQSFRRQRLEMDYASGEQFASFILSLASEGAAQTYTMLHEGHPVASQVVIMDKVRKIAYYWLAGAEESVFSTGLNQLMLHRILLDLQEKGFGSFDFVGAGTASIARYKSTYNFPLVPFYSVSRSRGAARLGMGIKRMMRRPHA